MSGQGQNIWEVLGIEPTGDKRAIRRAYARACRECHPEDHPEEFRKLHQAYEQALVYKAQEGEPEKRLEPPAGHIEAAEYARTIETAEGKEPEEDEKQALKNAPSPEAWDELLQSDPKEDRKQSSEGAPSPEDWDELLRAPSGEAGKEEEASNSALSPKRWDELLSLGMEEDAALPPSPDPLSWQRLDRTRFSSEALTGSEELLKQMKGLEAYAKENPPQEPSHWEQLMEQWDLLAEGSLFRQQGETPCYFQMLFSWLDGERGRLQVPTIIGLLRIYQIKGRIIGHPRSARRYERKIPELRRLTYEYIFYQTMWDEESFQKKFDLYGDSGKKRDGAAAPGAALWKMPGAFFRWISQHRLLWKLLCVLLILLLRYLATIHR